jgi:beta-lactamase class A
VAVTWAVDRGDGPEGVGWDVVVPAASTIKIVIALALFRALDEGRVDGRTPLVAPIAGDGALLDHLPGFDPTPRQAVTLMLAVSDNAATNALIALLGYDAVNDEAARLGLGSTVLRRRMLDLDSIAAGVDNTTSAGDLARVCHLLAAPANAPILSGLAATEHRDVLGEVAPQDVLVGVKRGFNDQANHDCGLVRTAHGAVGLAVCSSPPASPDALRRAAREALELAER